MNRRRRWRAVVVGLVALGMTATTTPAASATPTVGSDISFPQCGQTYPATPAFGVVGVNDGRPFTANPCLTQEYRWALRSGTVEFYLNTANPDGAGFAYGFDSARDAYATATSRVNAGPGHLWWLDVETANSWSDDLSANTSVIAGAIAFLHGKGVVAGIYSTRYQWGLITGGARMPSVPNWVPGAQSANEAPKFCAARRSFTGGPVVMTQYTAQFDYDYLCPGMALPAAAAPNLVQALLDLLKAL